MKHELKRERAGKAEMGSITPTCSCGWRGRTEYAYNDYCHTNVKEQEGDHIRNAHRGELETANATLEQQMMDACAPKNEREWWAFAEIGRLRAEVASLTAQLQSGESFHAVAVHQRDAAWGEVETLKATLTQQCKGFRADVEKLEAEVEALRADAERYRWLREQHWNDSPMCVVMNPRACVKLGSDCPSDERLDAAIDAAIKLEGE